jgi:hypothetical protein
MTNKLLDRIGDLTQVVTQKDGDFFEIEGTDEEGNPISRKETRFQLKEDIALPGPVSDMVDAKVAVETTDRETADNVLEQKISDETQAITDALSEEISNRQTSINAEATIRQQADNALQENIIAEQQTRISADETLQENIDNAEQARIDGDTDEATARQEAIAAAAGVHDFEPDRDYLKGALIFHLGFLYRTIDDFTSDTAFVDEDWERVAQSEWGTIIGELSDQADLQEALNNLQTAIDNANNTLPDKANIIKKYHVKQLSEASIGNALGVISFDTATNPSIESLFKLWI